jgi:hypothetical protein
MNVGRTKWFTRKDVSPACRAARQNAGKSGSLTLSQREGKRKRPELSDKVLVFFLTAKIKI